MTDKEALKRIAEKLRRTGASIPAPEVTGTIEGSVVTGLCIALALVEGEIEALAQEKALQALHDENERLGLYRDAYGQPEQEPVYHLRQYGDVTKEQLDRYIETGDINPPATQPAQRTWLGLSPNELNMISDSMKTWNSFQITDVYFAIEAKLKEKNNG
jgi:hypothetical protein